MLEITAFDTWGDVIHVVFSKTIVSGDFAAQCARIVERALAFDGFDIDRTRVYTIVSNFTMLPGNRRALLGAAAAEAAAGARGLQAALGGDTPVKTVTMEVVIDFGPGVTQPEADAAVTKVFSDPSKLFGADFVRSFGTSIPANGRTVQTVSCAALRAGRPATGPRVQPWPTLNPDPVPVGRTRTQAGRAHRAPLRARARPAAAACAVCQCHVGAMCPISRRGRGLL